MLKTCKQTFILTNWQLSVRFMLDHQLTLYITWPSKELIIYKNLQIKNSWHIIVIICCSFLNYTNIMRLINKWVKKYNFVQRIQVIYSSFLVDHKHVLVISKLILSRTILDNSFISGFWCRSFSNLKACSYGSAAHVTIQSM